ncbi:MAG: hypothetical protein KJP18_09700 [Gemmatimonadetes bacterium]|nr:hypothetical protein [Gemmatimonadota bacterium]
MSNLRIGDPADLVAYLREVLDDEGAVLREFGAHRIVQARGRVFSLHDTPARVSGPFETEAALIRADGLKKKKGPDEPEYPEVYSWYGVHFELDGDEVRPIDV